MPPGTNERTFELPVKWDALATELRLIAQATADEYRGRPYRAGEPPLAAAPPTPGKLRLVGSWFRHAGHGGD